MTTGRLTTTYFSTPTASRHGAGQELATAERLYARVAQPSWLLAMRERLASHPARLLTLDEITPETRSLEPQDVPGVQTVRLAQIVGSTERARSQDFDPAFRPVSRHLKDRWLSVAARRQAGRSLPPVELVQLGHQYFVVDGHHRVSVDRALGLSTIQAHVTLLSL